MLLKILRYLFFKLCMYVFVCVCVSVSVWVYVCVVVKNLQEQEALDPLDLELHVVMGHSLWVLGTDWEIY